MIKNICLIGNPNCGKTSLFNALTGSNQKTGNWSGVTTEKKQGFLKGSKNINVIDLPGIYSLRANSIDEKVVVEYLDKNKPDLIINVVDGTNLERNLYLSSELTKLNLPMIVAVNFCDEIKSNGILINYNQLQDDFGCSFIEISAKKRINIDKLISFFNKTVLYKSSIISKLDNEKAREYLGKKNYDYIKRKQTKGEIFTQKADDILTSKYFGLPIFICIIFLVYFLSSKVGGFFSNIISEYCDRFCVQTAKAMANAGIYQWFISLFAGAVLKGVGSVLAFSPQILILFLLMTIIEESGYAMRITFNLDRLFRTFGLGGKSVLPIILSCGCSVTGIMATRTIENKDERVMTIFLAPFMPCGAKTVVFAWFSYAFFNGNPFISLSMYFISLLCVFVFGVILKKFSIIKANTNTFVMEMPTLRMPSVKDVSRVLWEKLKDFVYKSGTIIFAVSVVLWFLSNFGIKGFTTNVQESFLFYVGNIIKYIFYPLGFGNWQASVSILTGIFAKEAVIETFELLNVTNLNLFANNFSVYAFMVFVLLSPPCAAAISTAKNELGSKKELAKMLVFQFVSAYLVSFLIVLIGKIICLPFGLLFCVIVGIILTTISLIIIVKRLKTGCKDCKNCKKGIICLKNSKPNTTI